MSEHDVDKNRLRGAIRALVRRFSIAERADVSCCGMTVAQAATLEALAQSQPLRLGELGRTLGIRASTLTRNLARLEDKGLVQRTQDPKDRRAARVGLTTAGVQAGADIERLEESFAGDILAALPPGTAGDTIAALENLLSAVRQATESCCSGAFDHLVNDSSCRGSGAKNDDTEE